MSKLAILADIHSLFLDFPICTIHKVILQNKSILAQKELQSCILYNNRLASSTFNFQMMKALGLPLGFLNQTPYDLEADGTVVVKQQKPRNRKRKQNGKVHSTF